MDNHPPTINKIGFVAEQQDPFFKTRRRIGKEGMNAQCGNYRNKATYRCKPDKILLNEHEAYSISEQTTLSFLF